MTRNRQRTVVGLVAVVGLAAAVALALFGLPYGKTDPQAFAHTYPPPPSPVHLHIDADSTNGTRPCDPMDDVAYVAVGSPHSVGLCVEDYVPNEVFGFDLIVLTDMDDALNFAPDPDGDEEPQHGGTIATGNLDDNPDANDGDDATGYKLGGGWDCTGVGVFPPRSEIRPIRIVCNAAIVGPDQDLTANPGLLATVNFEATNPGVENLSYDPASGLGLDTGNRDCGRPLGPTDMYCFGATIIKDYPPDIEVTKDCDDQVLVGAPIVCDIHVENIGAGPAPAVFLGDQEVGGPSLDFVNYGILPSDPGCILTTGLAGNLICPLGPMAAGASFDITLNLLAAGSPEDVNVNGVSVSVTGGLPDEDLGNNQASDSTHEFLPDIRVTKFDLTGGLPGLPADGWTFNLYAGACPPVGAPIASDVTSGGSVSFDDLATGAYCVEEELIDPAAWQRVDCADGVTPIAELYETLNVDGSAKLVEKCFGQVRKDVWMEKEPGLANLWICHGPTCVNNGEGVLVVDEVVSNVGGDPDGVGAYEFQVKFDHKVFDITVDDSSWLSNLGARTVDCSMTIINENSILHGCVSSGPVPGVQTDGVAATLTVLPEPDMKYRLTPGQQNGVVRTILDENCELADVFGDPLQDAAGNLLPGIAPGGLVVICSDITVTVRILEGDLNLDCVVDALDAQEEASRYGSFFGNLLYDPWYDLEPALKDFDIDIKDLQKVFGRLGSTCAVPVPPQDPLAPPP